MRLDEKKGADKKQDASMLSDVKKTKTLLKINLGCLNKITLLN
jgi:hypothetical protein